MQACEDTVFVLERTMIRSRVADLDDKLMIGASKVRGSKNRPWWVPRCVRLPVHKLESKNLTRCPGTKFGPQLQPMVTTKKDHVQQGEER